MPSLVEIDPVDLEKEIFKSCQLETGVALYLNNLESPSSKDAVNQVWSKLAQWFWRRRFFNFVNVFHYFVIISPWKRVGPFI